uniref:BHLH domain-containing protein n=1 Tax=Ananas comosus var. bracteatus TaxID=296719 RepID=A0A6V7NL08_ANACO|nr:unnamed protein product [Ananas comosus var. bracteatus]
MDRELPQLLISPSLSAPTDSAEWRSMYPVVAETLPLYALDCCGGLLPPPPQLGIAPAPYPPMEWLSSGNPPLRPGFTPQAQVPEDRAPRDRRPKRDRFVRGIRSVPPPPRPPIARTAAGSGGGGPGSAAVLRGSDLTRWPLQEAPPGAFLLRSSPSSSATAAAAAASSAAIDLLPEATAERDLAAEEEEHQRPHEDPAGLMPWERKMDTATLLEEANKYVRFLEAQVTALQTMPERSARFAPPREPPGSLPCPAAALGRLNRQQLLQVLVNSPVVQDRLYARGVCVFSAEQVASLRCSAERHRPPPLLLPPAAAADDDDDVRN